MACSHEESDQSPTPPSRRLLIAAAVTAVVVFVVYLPCLDAEFVDWDDDKNFLENPDYRGLAPKNLLWMLTTTHMGPYQPLSWLTLGVDYVLWGLEPRGYHLTNNLLHAAGAGVLCLVAASLLTIRRPSAPSIGVVVASMTAALSWALHPQHVESVAWITERRDVLSGLFYLLCVWSYLRAHGGALDDASRHRWEGIALGCFALSLLSKATAVSLPVVLVVLDVYPLRRLSGRPWTWVRPPYRRVLAAKFNYVLFAGLAVVVGFLGQASAEALRSLDQVGLVERIAIAAHAFAFYLAKTVWPVDLAPLYPRPAAIGFTEPRFLAALIAVVVVSVVVVLLRRRWPAGLAVWVCYVVSLLPVCGLLTIGDELVADRYSYLPTLALSVLLGGIVLCLWCAGISGGGRHVWRGLIVAAVAALTGVCGWQARRAMSVWHDSLSLWTCAAERRPTSYKAWNNLGATLTKARRFAEAERACRKAVDLRDNYATGYRNLGAALMRLGRAAEARDAFKTVLRIDPSDAHAYANLGAAYNWLDQSAEAVGPLTRALELGGSQAPYAHFQLGDAYRKLGQPEQAIKHYEYAIHQDRPVYMALSRLADVYLSVGRIADAEAAALRVVKMRTNRPDGHYALAQVRARQGRFREALAQLRKAAKDHQRFRDRAQTDPHLRELRLEPGFHRMMRNLPSTSPTATRRNTR